MRKLSYEETSPSVWPEFASLSWLFWPSLVDAYLFAACPTKEQQKKQNMRDIQIYLKAQLSITSLITHPSLMYSKNNTLPSCQVLPDVRLDKIGCVEPLSFVPSVHIPGDGVLFESIPKRKKTSVCVYYYYQHVFTNILARDDTSRSQTVASIKLVLLAPWKFVSIACIYAKNDFRFAFI